MSKKILFLSFYESNSRYIHKLSELIKNKYDFDSIQLCLYSSSIKYCKKNNLSYIDLPKLCRQNTSNKENVSVDRELYSFHCSLFPELESEFKKVAQEYLNYYININWEDIKAIVFIGDRRLYSSIGAKIARKNKVETIFFEPGPFGTMIFDPIGVNCNMSISNISIECMRKDIDELEKKYLLEEFFSNKGNRKFYSHNTLAYLNKVFDVIQSIPPQMFRRFSKLELLTGEGFVESVPYLLNRLPYLNTKKNNKFDIKNNFSGKYIFVPLQVPKDVQVIENGGDYKTIDKMISELSINIPSDYKLVIREHPMNKGRYGEYLYKIVDNNENMIIDNLTSINDLIDGADLVVVINSTVGFEAAIRGAAVLALGKTYYHHIVSTMNKEISLCENITNAIHNKCDYEIVELYAAYLYKHYLVKDNYKNMYYYNLGKAVELIC